jgi:hypothetical protein
LALKGKGDTPIGWKIQRKRHKIFEPLTSKAFKNVRILKNSENRAMILQDLLPVFCSTLNQIDTLELWRQGDFEPLSSYPITSSQAWAVVKLVFTSSSFTSNEKTAILDDQTAKDPGLTAELAYNTVIALDAGEEELETIYELFTTMDTSVTVKKSYAEGWNNSVHLNELVSIFKPRLFSAIPALSRKLSLAHFQFFYTNLAPIDDDL